MRRRLALAIAGVAAGAIVLFAVPLGIALRQVYRDEDLLRLERDAVAATRTIDISGSSGDPIELPRHTDRYAVYARDGRLRAGRAAMGDAGLVRLALRSGRPTVRSIGNGMVAAVPLLSAERVTGVFVAARSAAAASHDTQRAWLLLAALGAGVMAAALVAALLLGRGLARPLERVAQAARRLGHGDFTVRAPRSHVSEVDALAAALDATAERLGELVERERAFSADASHQLRTPLAALRIELEDAQLRSVPVDAAAALSQIDRLEQTIDTLLAVARAAPRGAGDADMTTLADELEAEWRPRLAADGRPLRVRLAGQALHAAAHEPVVREIVGVLLDNACRHGEGAVDLSVSERDGWIRVDVADEGPGFGDEAEWAFERGSSRNGHGIGLALARSLAQGEGGRLVARTPGPRPVLTLLLRDAADTGRDDH